jgi:hypothetical protein
VGSKCGGLFRGRLAEAETRTCRNLRDKTTRFGGNSTRVRSRRAIGKSSSGDSGRSGKYERGVGRGAGGRGRGRGARAGAEGGREERDFCVFLCVN